MTGWLPIVFDAKPVARLRAFGTAGLERLSEDGAPVTQRRRLALLVLLAEAAPGGIARAALQSLLWEASEQALGRAALGQALYVLRRALGPSAISGGALLALDPAVVPSDLGAFRDALAGDRPAEAVQLYAGPFLDGFYLSGAPRFERWVDGKRDALSRQRTAALATLADRARSGGDAAGAVHFRRTVVEVDPLSAASVAALMRALIDARNPALALEEAAAYAARLREETGEEVPVVVRDLTTAIRRGDASGPGGA